MNAHRRPSPEELAAAAWRKSSYSGGGGNECVEVARTPAWVGVRDSKDPQGPALTFSRDSWASFLSDVDRGVFDLG